MTLVDRINFRLLSLIHDDLYGLIRDPEADLKAAGVQAGQRVLEVGCGPGFFTAPAARIVGKQGSLVALDINPLAIEKVERKLAAAGVENARVLLGDAARTGLGSCSFDTIFVFGFPCPRAPTDAISAELHRLLVPSGTLATEGKFRPPSELFQPVGRERRISRFRKIESGAGAPRGEP
jgi:ubiquinone/menaquinone biosynthesis C-methylase UbiE